MVERQELPPLSGYRQDPERRLGIPAGNATAVNHWFCGLLALVLTTLLYVIVFWLPSNFFTRMLLDRGPTQHAAVFLGFWCALILIIKRSKLRLQSRALNYSAVPDQHDFVLSSQTADQVVSQLHQIAEDPERFVVFNRILIAISIQRISVESPTSMRSCARLANAMNRPMRPRLRY